MGTPEHRRLTCSAPDVAAGPEYHPEEYREGAAQRAGRLGDVGASGPRSWLPWLVNPNLHLLVSLFAQSSDALEAATKQLQQIWSSGCIELGAPGRAVWTRRGDVCAVHAAGNHPGVHGLWVEAPALGYRVAVRPSSREPFTPHRLISAMREAGLGDDQVAFLPTDRAGAGDIIQAADLAMVYGGDDVVHKYAGTTAAKHACADRYHT
ncbi:MAG: hypothetical protein ACRDRG_16175 [Pseudonocardiaceae bacterium]